jgi:hypothetical protein
MGTIAGIAKLHLQAMKIQEESGLSLDEALEVAKQLVKDGYRNQPAMATAPTGTPDNAAPIETLKSAALVKEFSCIWPSIKRDIRDKTRHANTLLDEANIKHSYYDVEKALRWAKTEGKITKQKAETYCKTSSNSVFTAMIGQIYNMN